MRAKQKIKIESQNRKMAVSGQRVVLWQHDAFDILDFVASLTSHLRGKSVKCKSGVSAAPTVCRSGGK